MSEEYKEYILTDNLIRKINVDEFVDAVAAARATQQDKLSAIRRFNILKNYNFSLPQLVEMLIPYKPPHGQA